MRKNFAEQVAYANRESSQSCCSYAWQKPWSSLDLLILLPVLFFFTFFLFLLFPDFSMYACFTIVMYIAPGRNIFGFCYTSILRETRHRKMVSDVTFFWISFGRKQSCTGVIDTPRENDRGNPGGILMFFVFAFRYIYKCMLGCWCCEFYYKYEKAFITWKVAQKFNNINCKRWIQCWMSTASIVT